MFDLSKKVLEKVSFDRTLFRKELIKAINWIKPHEKTLLKVWCLATFGNQIPKRNIEAFSNLN